jgi:hypothetical protein
MLMIPTVGYYILVVSLFAWSIFCAYFTHSIIYKHPAPLKFVQVQNPFRPRFVYVQYIINGTPLSDYQPVVSSTRLMGASLSGANHSRWTAHAVSCAFRRRWHKRPREHSRVCTAALCRFLVCDFTTRGVAVKKNLQKNGRNRHRDRMACDAPCAAAGNVDMVVLVDFSEPVLGHFSEHEHQHEPSVKSRQREKAPIEDRFNERDRSSNVRDVEPSRSAPSPGQTKCTGEIKQGLSTSSHSHA